MIEKIDVQNFQSHERLTIDVDPHVTTIVGSSDVGKSAVIRAIRFVAMNRPSGDAFVRDGSDLTKITIITDGHRIQRVKGKKHNSYKIDGQKLVAMGAEVPPQIKDVLNVSDINFQDQHDPPFWFSETSGEVSRQLNSIIDLGIIDRTLSNLGSRMRENGTRVTILSERAESSAKELKRSLPIKLIDVALSSLEARNRQIQEERARSILLRDLIENAIELDRTSKRCLKSIWHGKETLKKGHRYADLDERRRLLKNLLSQARDLQILAAIKIPNIRPLEILLESFSRLKKRRDELNNLLEEAHQLTIVERRSSSDARRLKKEFEKSLGRTCPLCHQKIKK